MVIDMDDLKRAPYHVLYQIESFLNIKHEVAVESVKHLHGDCFCSVSPFKNHIGDCMLKDCDVLVGIPAQITALLKNFYTEYNKMLFKMIGQDFGWNAISERDEKVMHKVK